MPRKIRDYKLTRFQHRTDRTVGDSQVRYEVMNAVALEIMDGEGHVGLGFAHRLGTGYPALAELRADFETACWPELDGQLPAALVHRVTRPRGGKQAEAAHVLSEALQIALWDLAAQQSGLPLSTYLGGQRNKVRTYASGLDFHLSDDEFVSFFGRAAAEGFDTFKIKIGAEDFEWDLHRLALLQRTVGPNAGIMIDANEAWNAKEAAIKLHRIKEAGFSLIWVEDPILRDDVEGLRALRANVPWTQVNSGEYLDVSGRRALLQAGGADILNVHGRVSDVMRIGWLAGDMGIPVALGNTFLETGIHTATALPKVEWMEFSFLNNVHLVDQPVQFRDGFGHLSDRPGLGMRLTDEARAIWAAPEPLAMDDLPAPPPGPASHFLSVAE